MGISFQSTWRDLVGRVAAAVGASTALLALLGDVPVGPASLRGIGACLGVLVVGRAGLWAVRRAVAGDLAARAQTSEE